MQSAVKRIADLIDHLRKEALDEQTKCFYCSGLHKTVNCQEPHRKAFHLSLLGVSAETWEEDLEHDYLQFENKAYVEHSRTSNLIE
ncbi:MAG: hypothetical protein ACLFPG_04860 [Desulfohalobiaceae bacterium]